MAESRLSGFGKNRSISAGRLICGDQLLFSTHCGHSLRKSLIRFPAEHALQTDAEKAGNTECALEARRVASLLNRDDGLPGNADRFAEHRLAHFMRLAQLADTISDGRGAAHGSNASAREEDL